MRAGRRNTRSLSSGRSFARPVGYCAYEAEDVSERMRHRRALRPSVPLPSGP